MATFETQPINGNTPSTEIPIYPTRCGALAPVAATAQTGYFNQAEIFFQARCESTGNLIVEGKDGFPLYYPSVSAGETLVTCGRRILTSATIDSVAVTTTVTGNIWVYGGK